MKFFALICAIFGANRHPRAMIGRKLSELIVYADRREDDIGRKLCVPGMDTLRTCDCNYKKGACHCSDSDCDWEPEPNWCDCPVVSIL